jgi:hypothetical protein
MSLVYKRKVLRVQSKEGRRGREKEMNEKGEQAGQ